LEGVKPLAHPGHLKGAAEPEHTDPPHLPRRLRLGGERRGKEAASDHCNKRSSVRHSIT
jgi:hypothetical protein